MNALIVMPTALLYTLMPVAAAVAGAAAAAWRPPGPQLRSAVQHFAAGVVFAAAAGELLPDLLHNAAPGSTIIGGACGMALMFAVREAGRRAQGPVALLATIGVDILVDGLVLGIGFAAGARQGLLLTIALTVEILFLGLAISVGLSDSSATVGRTVATTGAIALLLPVGTAIGMPLASLSGSLLNGLFAFGLIAWLYLVTEELLVEAHEVEERPLTAAMFFVGFLLLVVIEEIIGS